MAIRIRVYELDPLTDRRWREFLEENRSATLFHSPGWLAALRLTYGYDIVALTTSGPGERLANGIVFCRVRSWLTGRRLVSLPFSDHCAPLVEDEEALTGLLCKLKAECDQGRQRYVEIRWAPGAAEIAAGMKDSASVCLHKLDLSPSSTELFHSFHESCIQRKITRAQRVGLVYQEGTSSELLDSFYKLMALTRRRHRLLPQPYSWFQSIMRSMPEMAKIRMVFCGDRPVAGILTIRFKSTMTYKYGCSDPEFHNFGPMQLLMWRAIEEAKSDGLEELDMGRTNWDNKGLLTYKDRWGCKRFTLNYMRYPTSASRSAGRVSVRLPQVIFTIAPAGFLNTAGSILYRHIG